MGGVAAFGGARRRCPALGTPVLPPSTLIVNLSQLWLGRGGHFTPGMVAIKHSARRVLLRRMPAHTTPPIPAATGRNVLFQRTPGKAQPVGHRLVRVRGGGDAGFAAARPAERAGRCASCALAAAAHPHPRPASPAAHPLG